MTTADILAHAQLLYLREQLSPGDPALEQDFRALTFLLAEKTSEQIQTIDRLMAIIHTQHARLTHLTARVPRDRRTR